MHSASAEIAVDYLPRQLVWVGVGLVAMVIAFSFNYHTLLSFSLPLYLVALVALALVLAFGHEARRRAGLVPARLGRRPAVGVRQARRPRST